jgi:hypothetical protein
MKLVPPPASRPDIFQKTRTSCRHLSLLVGRFLTLEITVQLPAVPFMVPPPASPALFFKKI